MSVLQVTQTIQLVPVAPARMGNKRVSQPALPGMEPEPEEQPKVSNRQIAEVLSGVADLLESQRGNPYRVQAYRNAARGVLDLREPAADILARGERLPVPGLGQRLHTRILELVLVGSMTIQSIPSLPQGARSLLAVEHIGPQTAIRLHEELGIDTLEKLWWAAHQQRIRKLSGFGPRSEARIKESVEHLIKIDQREPLHGAA